MISTVARALDEDLRQRTVFVGGVTTGLFVTDEIAKEGIRLTDDVDIIVDIASRAKWMQFEQQLSEKGFKHSLDDEHICRMRLGKLKVDFMPDDEEILGFTNKWYALGIDTAEIYTVAHDLKIRILTPPLFVATKLEAHLGRGAEDLLMSRDLEDILTLIDGRKELVTEISEANREILAYIIEQFKALLHHDDFEFAVEANVFGDEGRKELIYERVNLILQME